jgi:hypothetical protein
MKAPVFAGTGMGWKPGAKSSAALGVKFHDPRSGPGLLAAGALMPVHRTSPTTAVAAAVAVVADVRTGEATPTLRTAARAPCAHKRTATAANSPAGYDRIALNVCGGGWEREFWGRL